MQTYDSSGNPKTGQIVSGSPNPHASSHLPGGSDPIVFGQFNLSQSISPLFLTGNTEDWNPSGLSGVSVVFVAANQNVTIGGVQGGSDGRILIFQNTGSFTVGFLSESNSSSAANRFVFSTSSLVLSGANGLIVRYDGLSSRWRPIAHTVGSAGVAAGGGGGGTTDHSALTNLAWASSGHTGSANTIAGFDTAGTAKLFQPTINYQSASRALEAVTGSGVGILVKTSATQMSGASLAGTAARISVTNPNGVAGDPAIDIDSTYVGQTSITTLGTITTGTWSGVDIAVNKGGTGAGAANAALNNLSPATNRGDLIVYTGSFHARLATGSNGQYLVVDNTAVTGMSWQFYPNLIAAVTASNVGLLTLKNTTQISGSSIAGTSARIAVTNPNGVAGDPTIDIDSTYVGQTSITTLGTITTGTWNGVDITVGKGGTGAGTAASGFNNLSPLTNRGDLIVYTGSFHTRLASGSNGQFLVTDNTTISGLNWHTIAAADLPAATQAANGVVTLSTDGAETTNVISGSDSRLLAYYLVAFGF